MMADKLYDDRDIIELDKAGGHYTRHVAAMTAEGLHDKSAIAAELAWRDRRIQLLCREVARLNVKLSMSCETPADDCECGGCVTARDFNEATDGVLETEREESESAMRTVFECRCCDRTTSGRTDGTHDEGGWGRIDGIDGPNSICPDCIADPASLDALKAEYQIATISAAGRGRA